MDLFTHEIQKFILREFISVEGNTLPQEANLLEECKGESSIDRLSERYRAFLEERESFDLEETLKREFPLEEYIALGLPAYTFPRLYQALPRNSDAKGIDGVKKRFSHLPALRRHFADKAHLSLYREMDHKVQGTLVILSWMLADGLGDFVASQEIAQFLREHYSHLNVEVIALVPQKRVSQVTAQSASKTHILSYERDFSVSDFPKEIYALFQKTRFLLQTPTFYPHFPQLMQAFPHLSAETLGEYGFIDSAWCHPVFSDRSCMGLHVLEKGILIKKPPEPKKREEKRFFFAYLLSVKGTIVYLHALLSFLEEEAEDIYLVVASFGPLAEVLAYGLFSFADYGIKEILLEIDGKYSRLRLLETGKVLHITSPFQLTKEECQDLFFQSSNPVVCRGDQSFSEAISYGKVFLYDPAPHAQPFLEDLYALAQTRLWNFPSALNLLRLPLFLLDKEAHAEEIGKAAGKALKDPSTHIGFQKLSQIIKEEHSIHPFLLSFINRAFYHLKHPFLKEQEDRLLDALSQGKLSFTAFIQKIKAHLPLHENR